MGVARLRAAVAVIGLAAASGCSGSATLELRDGSEMKGRIMRSDANTVFLEPEDEGASESPGGRERSVDRERIADVYHPGSSEMALGLPRPRWASW